MPTTAFKAQKHQERWNEIVRDPALRDLPYKVEINNRGQIVLSPHTAYHARQQKAVMTHLDTLLPEGEAYQEYPVATAEGTKQVDVMWASEEREREMQETGDPPTLAPEICVEVLSDSNTWAEMEEKRSLYLEAGAKEVWIVDEEGEIHFFAEKKLGHSHLAPDAPTHLQSAGTES